MDVLSKIRYWLIPQGVYRLFKSIFVKLKKYRPVVESKQSKYETDSFLPYKDKHLGERCFILASGPSIKNMDLTLLKNETCIAVGQFFLHPDIDIIRPKYHVFAPQHAPFDDTTNKIIFDNYSQHYTFPVKCFIGSSDYEYSYYNFLNSHPDYKVDASYIDHTEWFSFDESNYMNPAIWDITKKPFPPRTVIYSALQVAYYLGFKEIYLLGVDHDYISQLHGERNHFYKEEQSFSEKGHLAAFDIEHWFDAYARLWKHYRLIREFFDSKSVKVYNASYGGKFDVFERINYLEVFNKD